MPKKRTSSKKKIDKKWILIGAAVLVGVIMLAGGGNKKKDAVEPSPAPSPTSYVTVAPATQIPVTPIPATPTTAPTEIPTLRKGSSGQAVKELQQRLITLGFLSGSADGDFGAKTEQAVKDFQLLNRLTADGVAGPETISLAMGRYAQSNRTVYKTESGHIYHFDSTCSGMKNSQSLTLVEAMRQGLDRCDRCGR